MLVGEDRDRLALSATVFVVLFAQILLYPGIADLVGALGAPPSLNAGAVFVATEFVAYVVFAPIWGAVSDSYGRRVPFVVLASAVACTAYVAIALSSLANLPFGAVLGIRFVQGAATVGSFSLALTTLMDLGGGHGRNMGAAGVAIGAGVGFGAPVGGFVYETGTLTPLYLASALLGIAAVLAFTVEDRVPTGERGIRRAVRRLSDTPAVAVPYAFGFVDRLTAGFFALVGTFYFRETFVLGPAETGVTLAFFFAPFALLQYPLGRLSDRVGRVPPVVVGSLVYGVAVFLVVLTPTLTEARAAMLAVGVLGALVAPATMALVTDLSPEDGRGAAMAGFNVAGSLGFLAGVVGGTALVEAYGYTVAFGVVGGAEVVIAVLALPFLLRLDVD
ncbi:MFS transporter [Haladaptatus sp. F3-133]|uniref:MFS transporter n=1 Tax=Halorutilus salinus TaxID=2487751 RepID=A0A9Q4GGM6_9EURY|nr:MFS transporter [Halorutilus salinus]MCX2817910.1 MFS transporter [Halorutilus salinus]